MSDSKRQTITGFLTMENKLDPDGEWIHHTDHEAALSALREENERLRHHLDLAFELSDAQDTLDNHETSGPNAEDYFTLMRRRNGVRAEFHNFDVYALTPKEQGNG